MASRLLEALRERLPEPLVLLAPGSAFFVRSLERPEGVEGEGELLQLAELHLESHAPFPIDQLAWGLLWSPDSQHLLLYATPWQRLEQLGLDDLPQFYQALPGFITRFGEVSPARQVRFLCENGCLHALLMEAGDPVPAGLQIRPVQAEILTDDAILEARQQLEAKLPPASDWPREEGVWVGAGITTHPQAGLSFAHRRIGLPGVAPDRITTFQAPWSEAQLWAADLRRGEDKQRLRAQRRLGQRLWLGLAAAAVFTLTLLLLQSLVWGLGFWHERRENAVAEQLEPVQELVDMETLTQRLVQSTQENLEPFRMLTLLNAPRPRALYYERVRSRGFNTLEIEGKMDAATTFNTFTQRLRELPFVADLETSANVRGGQAEFELRVTFGALPPLDASAAPSTDAARLPEAPANPAS